MALQERAVWAVLGADQGSGNSVDGGQPSLPSSSPFCPHRLQGTHPPLQSTPRIVERTSSLWPWPPQPLTLCQQTLSSGPVTATPSPALRWLPPQLSSAALPPRQPPPQTHPRTPGPPSHTGLRPPPAWPLWAQVSPASLPEECRGIGRSRATASLVIPELGVGGRGGQARLVCSSAIHPGGHTLYHHC